MIKFCRLVHKSEPVQIVGKTGQPMKKETIVLQECEGQYGETYVAACFDKDLSSFSVGCAVMVSLSFFHSEKDGNYFQNITVREIHRI